MNCSWASPLLRSRYPLALLAGVLWAASFPRIGVAGLAWIAPGLMVLAASGKRGWESFRIGYLAGLAHYLASLYWLLLIPYRWHGIPIGPATGWLSLSAYLALYPATWTWLVASVLSPPSTFHCPPSTVFPPSSDRGLGSVLGNPAQLGVLGGSWGRRMLWAICGAALWVALEMLVSRLFTGFPWNLLGSSQYQMLPLIQVASVTGIYGVSFLAVWGSLSLLSAVVMVVRRPTARSAWLSEIVLPMLVVALVFQFGFRRLAAPEPAERTLKVALVQPSIPQTLIWDTSRDQQRFQELVRISEQALTNHPDLLVWPEAAVPSYARWDTNIYPAITNLVRQHHVWLILGSDDLGLPAHPTRPDEVEYYNASFLVNPQGEFINRYRKRNLVVFGEYIPLVRWLPFIKWFTPIEGGFTPGARPIPFTLNNPHVNTSVLICFEDIFPHLAREYAEDDTDFLVNLTNNGWFGEGAAQWQHAAGALFRAVENGLPLIRCSNNGLTACVDPQGRLRQIFRDDRSTIYGPGFLLADVPLLAKGERRVPTLYHQHGDWFGWLCVGIAVAALLRRCLPRRRRGVS